MAESLPAERRHDLVAEVTAHSAEARAAGATSEDEVREVLRRLGDPADFVAAGTDGLVQVDVPPRLRARDAGALVLLLLGPFLLMIGWLIGVWLLWTSDRWTRGEKLLGTLGWPVAYVAAMVCDYVVELPLWATVVVSTVITIAVVVVLARNARPERSGSARTVLPTSQVASGNS